MMRFGRTALRRAFMSTSTRSSSGFPPNPPQKEDIFTRTKNFLYNNRQAFLNILTVYFAFSLSVSNFQGKEKLKEANATVARLTETNEDLSAFVDTVSSDSFIESATSLMQKATTVDKKKEVLRTIITDAKPKKRLTEEDLIAQELAQQAAAAAAASTNEKKATVI